MEYVTIIITILLELIFNVIIINSLVGKKANYPVRGTLLYVLLAGIYIVFVPADLVNGCYLLMLFYIKICYKIPWKDSLITTLLSVLLIGVTEIICIFPFAFILNGKFTESVTNLMAATLSLILWCVPMRKIPVWYLKKWCRKKDVWYMVVAGFSLVLMLAKIVKYNMTFHLEIADYVFILVALAMIWMLSWRLIRYRYEDKLRKKYNQAFESVIEQIRSRQHKFQNHLDAIYSLHNIYDEYEVLVEEQKKYLNKLNDYEMPAEVLALQNPILISHVYEKITEAQELGLHIKMKIKYSLDHCELDEIHMIEILGTLLDNAIQDMQQTLQQKFLIFEVEKEDGIVIRVANPHEELTNHQMQQMFKSGYSTKGENRGIGLAHVKKLAQKHNFDLLVENRKVDEQNYLFFSVLIGRNTPMV